MEITKEDVKIFIYGVRRVLEDLRKLFERAWAIVKKVVEKNQIRKYWDSKELRKLVYSKRKVKTKRLKKKYDDKIKKFIFTKMKSRALS